MRGIWIGLVMITWGGVAMAQDVDLRVLAQVESSGIVDAVGDGGKALGLYQLHKEAVSDANRLLGTRYRHTEALDSEKASIMAHAYINRVIPHYLRAYGLRDTVENRLTAYNMGIGAVRHHQTAERYIARYFSNKKEMGL